MTAETPPFDLVQVDVWLHERRARETPFGVDLVGGIAFHARRDRGDALTSDRDVVEPVAASKPRAAHVTRSPGRRGRARPRVRNDLEAGRRTG